jgi:hypothetical protein
VMSRNSSSIRLAVPDVRRARWRRGSVFQIEFKR